MEVLIVVASLAFAWVHGYRKGRKHKAEQVKNDVSRW